MANLKDLKGKIISTKKTQQTTKAMKMVSAAKLRRAQDNIVAARPYAKRLMSVIQRMATNPNVSHPYLNKENKTPENLLLVVLTSDRGLCGGFNSAINKYTDKFLKEKSSQYKNIDLFFVGKKGFEFFKKRGIEGKEKILDLARIISYSVAEDISEKILALYQAGVYDEVRIIYNEFKSAISQEVVDERLLSVEPDTSLVEGDTEFSSDFVFEPEIDEILDDLLEKHFAIQIYRCLQESVASEHGARMSAMENASNNAAEMIDALELEYNKLRQAKITTELIEITSGAEAL